MSLFGQGRADTGRSARPRLLISVAVALGVAGAAWGTRIVAQQPVFRGGVDVVNISVTVTDKAGALQADLRAEDFELYEDGVKQTVRYFWAGDAQSRPETHLGLLLDVSESMGGDIAFTKNAVVKFLTTLGEVSDVTFVDFDTEVRAARYGRSDLARLIERIRLKKARGLTALYDAIAVYLDDAGGQDGRKIMLVYTDGGDTQSSIRFSELMDLLKASDVVVYAIGSFGRQSSPLTESRVILREIAEITGGRVFFPRTTQDLERAYAQVLAEIGAQYTFGYVSTNPSADGAWRKVEVRVTRADGRMYRVRSRKGYFAPYRVP